jgi:hypothetical protein
MITAVLAKTFVPFYLIGSQMLTSAGFDQIRFSGKAPYWCTVRKTH